MDECNKIRRETYKTEIMEGKYLIKKQLAFLKEKELHEGLTQDEKVEIGKLYITDEMNDIYKEKSKEMFLVSFDQYSDFSIEGVFDDFEKARSYAIESSLKNDIVRLHFYNLNTGDGETRNCVDFKDGKQID